VAGHGGAFEQAHRLPQGVPYKWFFTLESGLK
jgi:hypothetical protein